MRLLRILVSVTTFTQNSPFFLSQHFDSDHRRQFRSEPNFVISRSLKSRCDFLRSAHHAGRTPDALEVGQHLTDTLGVARSGPPDACSSTFPFPLMKKQTRSPIGRAERCRRNAPRARGPPKRRPRAHGHSGGVGDGRAGQCLFISLVCAEAGSSHPTR